MYIATLVEKDKPVIAEKWLKPARYFLSKYPERSFVLCPIVTTEWFELHFLYEVLS